MERGNSQGGNRRARVAWTVAFVGWLLVVWGHSLMGGEASSLESSRFVFLVRPLFTLLGSADESLMTFAVRKTAHFTEYAILAMLGRKMAVAWLGESRRSWALSLCLWVAVPCIDECIQLFVPGRAGMPTDVLIDMFGGLLGMVLVTAASARGKGDTPHHVSQS